ncbi:MAG: class I SAM-dependent RNA methyltransferase [Spirochaetaceae bacterium]|jgi:putative N6-adenine-specific DNA methylase|nr:class I SAM-dependent RNA methyltransferase [Spirochaetaceae bacterium]
MQTLAALSAVGAERVTANELRKLGLSVLETGFGRVRFQADLAGCYRALMALRTADRVLWEAARFPAADFEALFEGTRSAPWESVIPRNMGLRVVKVRSSRSKLRSIPSVQAVVHKAAAERLCGKYRVERLNEDPAAPCAEVRVYLERDEAQVLLDLSGEPLFKRGYRSEGGPAPLRETTAAALIFLSNWKRKFPLYDPFCGSGTIAIEAALYAWDAAPGLGRTFALSALGPADPSVERAVREELRGRVNFERTVRINGSDADTRAVSMSRSNLLRALELARGKPAPGAAPSGGPEALPAFSAVGMKEARPPAGEAGFIITNPPYGIRMGGEAEAEALYASMPALGLNFPGWKLAVITNHAGFESHFGHKADSCREITNGAVQSYFYQYDALRNTAGRP